MKKKVKIDKINKEMKKTSNKKIRKIEKKI